jgi:hypothetical protein
MLKRASQISRRWPHVFVAICAVATGCAIPLLISVFRSQIIESRWLPVSGKIGMTEMSQDGFRWSWQQPTYVGMSCVDGWLLDPAMNSEFADQRGTAPGNAATYPPYWSSIFREPNLAPIARTRSLTPPSISEAAFGLPFRSLMWRREYFRETPHSLIAGADPPAFAESGRTSFHWDLLPASWIEHDGEWPVDVIWPGMIANVLIYFTGFAAPWWFADLRRAIRRRRGACTRCGYSLAGDRTGVCPECGQVAATVSCRVAADASAPPE